MAAAPVVHFEITGRDGKKLQDFYAGMFGWEIDANNPMNYGIVNTGEGISGGIGTDPDSNGILTFYVAVDDVQATLDEAVKLGARVVMPVTEIPGYVTLALFSDPEGNVVGIIKNQ